MCVFPSYNFFLYLQKSFYFAGCSNEHFLFPLLSCIAGLMGQSAIQIHPLWREQCTLWTAVATGKSTKKTTVLRVLNQAVLEFQKSLKCDFQNEINKDCSLMKGSLVDEDNVVFEHRGKNNTENGCGDITQNGGNGKSTDSTRKPCMQINLGEDDGSTNCYPDSVYSVVLHEYLECCFLEAKRIQSPNDSARLKSLYDSSVCINSAVKPNLSIGGFVKLESVSHLLTSDKYGICDRFLITAPNHGDVTCDSGFQGIPHNVPKLCDIFSVVYRKHSQPLQYTFMPNALGGFQDSRKEYDEWCKQFASETCFANHKALFGYVPGLIARLCSVLNCLSQATKFVVYREDIESAKWETRISKENLICSVQMIDHVIQTKLMLLNPGAGVQDDGNQRHPHEIIPVAPGITPKTFEGNDPRGYDPKSMKRSVPLEIQSGEYKVVKQIKLVPKVNMSRNCLPVVTDINVPTNSQIPVFPRNQSPENSNESTSGSDALPLERASSMSSVSMSPWQPQPPQLQPVYTVKPSDPMAALDAMNDQDLDLFLSQIGYKIKKFLEFRLSSQITPSIVAQRHLTVPLSREEMEEMNTNNKYPVTVAREFLLKMVKLGFGYIKGTNRRSWYFCKFRYSELSEKAKQRLAMVHLSREAYDSSFSYDPEIDPSMQVIAFPETEIQTSASIDPRPIKQEY